MSGTSGPRDIRPRDISLDRPALKSARRPLKAPADRCEVRRRRAELFVWWCWSAGTLLNEVYESFELHVS
jgi:hypothetical protein